MEVYPEKGESLATLLLRHWDTYDAELKADLLQLAERLGCNWWDVVVDCRVKQSVMPLPPHPKPFTDPLFSDDPPFPTSTGPSNPTAF